jgi:glycosyltransferase involved in cell wall biosynthesis
MKIRLIGQRNATGIGNHYMNFAKALKQLHGIRDLVEEIDFQDQSAVDRAISESKPTDINISFVGANIHDFFQGHIVQWVVFESTRIFDRLKSVLDKADSIWVPSEWGRQILIDNGYSGDIIFVVPEGVDATLYHPYARQKINRPFRFTILGKYEERKSFEETIQAFAQAFGNLPDVELFIKSHAFENSEQASQNLIKILDDYHLNNVNVYWGEMNYAQLAELYRSSDVFVFPSKGEGWGLPLIEAAACGCPIITTVYSGQTEYLQEIKSSVLSVDYVVVPIDSWDYHRDFENIQADYGLWARPDVYSIAEAMKHAKRNHKNLAKNALKNSYLLRKDYSWAQSAERALVVMESKGWFLPG